MNYLHLQEDGKPVKFFKTWRACASYIYDNKITQYFIAEEDTGLILVKRREKTITLVPEHYPPASVLPML